MTNVSIISACNNNCRYCFQQDSYHKLNKMLSYEEILDVFNWSKGIKRIGILGGEPTLHPDIAKVTQVACETFPRAIIFSNLLVQKEKLADILKFAPDLDWLINTTTRDELRDLFEENMEFMSRFYKRKVSIALTFINDAQYDRKNTLKMIRLAKTYPNIVDSYRISVATPYHKCEVKLESFDEPVLNFCRIARKETPETKIFFDCSVNNCQISFSAVAELVEVHKVLNLYMSHLCTPVVDISADKTVKYCASLPDDFGEKKLYSDFKNFDECYSRLSDIARNYLEKNVRICEKAKNCNNNICCGPCLALTEYLRRQQKTF